MKRKTSINKLEEKIEAGQEVVDQHFDVKNAVLGRPRKFQIHKNVIKTNLDLTKNLADELDSMASDLNISRQAVIKMMIRQSLDDHYKAYAERKKAIA